jgi:hypothetical protein
MTKSRSRRRRRRTASRAPAQHPATQIPAGEPAPDIDALLVRSIVRWSLITVSLIVGYVVAVFAGYPYPEAIGGTRGAFYVTTGAVLVIAAGFITFLGYRLVTMRVIGQGRTLYLIFLPIAMVLSSLVAILLVAAPE